MIRKILVSLLLREEVKKIENLESKVKDCEEKIEKLMKSIDILIKFGEGMSSDINLVASHVLVLKASMGDFQVPGHISHVRNSNDDDLLN